MIDLRKMKKTNIQFAREFVDQVQDDVVDINFDNEWREVAKNSLSNERRYEIQYRIKPKKKRNSKRK